MTQHRLSDLSGKTAASVDGGWTAVDGRLTPPGM